MLIEINLAPGASGGRVGARRLPGLSLPSLPSIGGDPRTVLGIGAVVLLVFFALFSFWRMGARASTLESQIQREVADSTRYASTIALVESLRAREDTITQKIGVIRSVDSRRYVWPHLLDEISLAVPAFLWLTELQTIAPTDTLQVAPSFAVQGNAGSTQALTRFMKNLEASSFISGVTLVTSEQEVVEGRAIQRFSLEARYTVPPSSEIRTVPVVILEE